MAQHSPSLSPSQTDNSLNMSPNHITLQTLTSLYKETTQAFLLRNYDSAYSLCMSSISKLAEFPPVTVSPSTKIIQIKIWCLYINLIAALLAEKPPIATKDHEIKRLLERPSEKICEEVYTKIVTTGFNNEDGEIPGEIIIACTLLCLHQNCPKFACQVIEDWYCSLPKSTIVHLNQDDSMLKCYEKVVQLYVLHVLPKLKEWDKASSFLAVDQIIDKEHKKVYEQSLIKLKEKSSRPLTSRKSKPKKEKSKREDTNDYGYEHHRLDYGRTNNVTPSINHHKLPNGSLSPEFRVRSSNMLRNNHRQSNIRSFISGSNRNILENRQDLPATTATTMITNIHRFIEAFALSLQRVASKVSVPKILLLFTVIFLISGWNKIRREFLLRGMAKFWETVKAGTTITYF
ncbi:14250_t:CDS:2 [Acaulospora morrowiae]|uniref:14250_t:CDS:1 n=1 Tax=Acaulospora morrowiae TaxID=94023 RepID=A0A9N8ZR26_9GLOM|nr:14250_t:CDS:2 [Acaulospora morrowiae]